jgi:hypothetical protein
MRLSKKMCFKEPTPVCDLTNMANLLEHCNAFMHYYHFALAIQDILYQDRPRVPSVNDTFIVFYWNKDIFLIEDRPVASNNLIYPLSKGRV